MALQPHNKLYVILISIFVRKNIFPFFWKNWQTKNKQENQEQIDINMQKLILDNLNKFIIIKLQTTNNAEHQ